MNDELIIDIVREYIEDYGPCATAPIMKAVGVANAEDMTRCLKALRRHGLIRNTGGVGLSAIWVSVDAAPAPDPVPLALGQRTPLELAWASIGRYPLPASSWVAAQ